MAVGADPDLTLSLPKSFHALHDPALLVTDWIPIRPEEAPGLSPGGVALRFPSRAMPEAPLRVGGKRASGGNPAGRMGVNREGMGEDGSVGFVDTLSRMVQWVSLMFLRKIGVTAETCRLLQQWQASFLIISLTLCQT